MNDQRTSDFSDLDKDKIDAIDLLLRQSYELTQQERYDEALLAAQKALARSGELPVTNNVVLSSCLYQLAVVYQGKGDSLRVEQLFKESLTLAEDVGYDRMIASSLHGLADLYYRQKEEDKAQVFYERARLLWQRQGGDDHPGTIIATNRLAHIALTKRNCDEAKTLICEAISSEERVMGADHVDVAKSLTILAEILIKTGEYQSGKEAIARIQHILATSDDEETRSRSVGVSLYFSKLYVEKGEFDYAVALSQQAIEKAEVIGAPRYPDITGFVQGLATVYEEQGRYSDAESEFNRALALSEEALGKDHKDSYSLITDLARIYDKQGFSMKSESFYQRAVNILAGSVDSEQNHAAALGQLGWFYLNHTKYEKARLCFDRAVEIAEATLGSASTILAIHLNSLAFLHYRIKDYFESESIYLRSQAIVENVVGKDHLEGVASTTGLADVYSQLGRFERAEELYSKSLAIRESQLGANHPDVAVSVDSLAWFYVSQGWLGKAERLFKRVLEIRERRFGPTNPITVPSLNNLANVYRSIGDYQKTRALYERALAINELTLGNSHRLVGYSLNNLGSFFLDTGGYAEAKALLERSLAIAETTSGIEHPDVAYVLTLLALVHRATGDFQSATSLNKRALIIDEGAYGSQDISVATDLRNLALIYTAQGKFTDAENLFLRGLEIEERAKGTNHPDLAETLLSLAYFYGAKGDIPNAISTLRRGTEISEGTIGQALTSATGTEDQKCTYMAMDSVLFETRGTVALHMQFAPTNPEAERLALTTILRRKGRVLDAVSDSFQIIRNHLGNKDGHLLQSLANARSLVAALSIRGPGHTPVEQFEAELEAAHADADKLESEIASHSSEFRDVIRPVTIEQVQAVIPSGAVLIEIAAYQTFNPSYRSNAEMWGPQRYAAYAINHEGFITSVDLGESRIVDEAAAKFRTALKDPGRADVKVVGQRLYEKLVRPLVTMVGAVQTIFLSADGELNLIPFGALVDENNNFLIENHSVTYLTSGRDLLRINVDGVSKQGPLIIGNPDYDADFRTAPAAPTVVNRFIDFPEEDFSLLPGTEAEVIALRSLLTDAIVLTGRDAAKSTLKAAAAPSILHIATHGFFLPDQEPMLGLRRSAPPLFCDRSPGRLAPRFSNPLLRSGLALAGANKRDLAVFDNGILTALEMASLDLWGTQLVVLSACETGLGDTRIGDGVYGLRRALVIAGSETQIMSLWEVDDAATRDLMVDYYDRLLKGEGRGEALRNVQLEMCRSGLRNHPFYWAAFIQSGNWRRLNLDPATSNAPANS